MMLGFGKFAGSDGETPKPRIVVTIPDKRQN